MTYKISIRGCDATTECKLELTPEEIKGVLDLAQASTDESDAMYHCYPNIEEITCLDAGDSWVLWSAETYRQELLDKKQNGK